MHFNITRGDYYCVVNSHYKYIEGICHAILLNINAFLHIIYSVRTAIISYNVTRPDVFR